MRTGLFLLFSTALLFGACNSNSSSEAEGSAEPIDSTAQSLSSYTVDQHPEAVAVYENRFFVGHFGPQLEPQTQDGNGYIAVYNADGQKLDTLIYGLDAPKGLEVVGQTLYVADVDTLWAIDVNTGEKTGSWSFTGQASFLNGLSAGPDASLFLSATDAGKIWKVVPEQNEATVLAELTGANGVYFDSGTESLYAVSYQSENPQAGHLYKVDLQSGATTKIGEYGGMLDGLTVLDGKAYTSDWNPGGLGRMVEIDLSSGASRIITESAQLAGPADFDMLGDGLALVPTLMTNTVVAVQLAAE